MNEPHDRNPQRCSESARSAIDAGVAGILFRLDDLPNLARVEVMAPAAAPSAMTLGLIQRTLESGRLELRRQLESFRSWLRGPGRQRPVQDLQRRYTLLRLRWIGVLGQYDIFADALSQRSERPIGIWLAGLDHLAADALRGLPMHGRTPAVICYLDRGAGAAIRRARTRLPGGLHNPVAIIRVPRERMVGPGVGSSIVHEVGHQSAALLCMVESLRLDFATREAAASGLERRNWAIYARWISEIVADFWSVGFLGIASTIGLIEVVSLPRPFVFRVSVTDPHPAPWVRVLLSARIGQRLHPDPAWTQLTETWTARYPLNTAGRGDVGVLRGLAAMADEVAAAVADHRSRTAGDRPLADLVPAGARRPAEMRRLAGLSSRSQVDLATLRPTLALAALGAADPSEPTDREVERLLQDWAMSAYGGGNQR